MGTNVSAKKNIEEVPLVREFLNEHQQMLRLLLHTLACLEEGDVDAAVASAKALNRVGGPHIAYEESEL